MNIDKEVFSLWTSLNPEEAFACGLKKYAGKVWIPSHHNIKTALKNIEALQTKTKDITTLHFLRSIKSDLLTEEPHDAPDSILGLFFSYLTIEGINDKHIRELCEQSLNVLSTQKYLLDKKWPIEFQIYTAQSCDGANSILDVIKKKVKPETKQAITSLQKNITEWKNKTTTLKLKRNDFVELYPLLKKHSKSLGRKHHYKQILKDEYGYLETAEQIENLALNWLKEEIPQFNSIIKKLAKKYKTQPTNEKIDSAIKKEFHIPPKNLVQTINTFRKTLEPLANQKWVKIKKGYDVRVIETPPYLTPFLPTAAMQSFNSLTKPFCIFFATTDTKAAPSTSLPDIAQTIIHEEYGHCVNFHNSYTSKRRYPEILGSHLDIPLTEGISFYRELEALRTLRAMQKKATTKQEKNFIEFIERYGPFNDFVDCFEYTVRQWRMVRFLRALSDVRINTEKQTFPQFIEWANKETGLTQKMIFDQTFHFQENAGYAPCYSIFGQKLKNYQAIALKKGHNTVEFNTYVASRGFPTRAVFEKEIEQKFTR